jgi:AraC family transcriptional regulator
MPAATAAQPILARAVRGSPGTLLTLTHYAEGESQPRHVHDHTQVSFLLAGGIAETIGSRRHEVRTAGACVKLAGVDHENIWGRTGALMLTVKLVGADAEDFAAGPIASWKVGRPLDRRLLHAMNRARTCDQVDDVVVDLIAALSPADEDRAASPSWLGRVNDALWDGETLGAKAAARLAGVHRVYFSRAFARHMGVPFSAYRRHVMLSRAVEASLRTSDGLASVAAGTGFADQSHMNRIMGNALGIPPRALRHSLVRAA